MRKIYVGNIPFSATEQDISDLFSEYGEIKSLKMIKDKYTGQFRGFCFIELENEENAQKAISALNEKLFMGKTLVVSEAKPQQPRSGFYEKRGSFSGNKGARKNWR